MSTGDAPDQRPVASSLDRPLKFMIRFPTDIRNYLTAFVRYDVMLPDHKTFILGAMLLLCSYVLVEIIVRVLAAAVWPFTWLVFFVFFVPNLQDGSVEKRIANVSDKFEWLWRRTLTPIKTIN